MKLLATCNCLPHAGKEISAEGQVLNFISRLEEISTGDMGNLHTTNAYRIGAIPQPPGYRSMDLWSGSSLSQACPSQLVGTKPSQHGRALVPFLLGTFSLLTWTRDLVGQLRWAANLLTFTK